MESWLNNFTEETALPEALPEWLRGHVSFTEYDARRKRWEVTVNTPDGSKTAYFGDVIARYEGGEIRVLRQR